MKITFNNAVNESVQVGDVAYYVEPSQSGGFDQSTAAPTEIGIITTVESNHIKIDNPVNTPPDVATNDSFIMFRKNNIVNDTSVLGEYIEVTLKNSSSSKAELFSIGSEVALSSK
jgi:hypothetical protein